MSQNDQKHVKIVSTTQVDSEVLVNDKDNATKDSDSPMCIVCKEEEAEFQPDSCDCAFTYCKKCAMKCATGGKCKKCKKLYMSLKRSVEEN